MKSATKVEKFVPKILDDLRKECDEAFSKIAANHGITIRLGRITYQDFKASGKVEFGIACENGGNAAERQEYLEGATSYGLKKAWLGKTFNYKDGKTYTIVGLKARSSKFPVVCINDAGQKMVFTSELITAYMTNPTNIEQALVEAQIKEMRKAYVWHGALGSLGLKEAWLDKTFKHNGHACTIVGLHEKGRHGNRETFVVVQDNEEKKKLYLAPIDAVVKAMGGKTKAAA